MSVTIVTGAARGIGLEVVRQLSGRGVTVLACARDLDALASATSSLTTPPLVQELDVASDDDAEALRARLERDGLTVDAIVNNAGVALDEWATSILDVPLDTLRANWEVNSLGALRVIRAAAPFLAPGARIVNVSSGMGQLAEMGRGVPAYRTSKTLLNAIGRVLAAELEDSAFVASVCPGWVRSDMGGTRAPRSLAEGADTIVWLATGGAPSDAPSGLFWRDRAIQPF